MTVHGRRVRRRLLTARTAQFEPRVRPHGLTAPVPVWKSTSELGWPRGQRRVAVRDPAESVAFCEKYLGCQEIEVPDATLCPRSVPVLRHRRAAPRS